jgi:hypothetical protein
MDHRWLPISLPNSPLVAGTEASISTTKEEAMQAIAHQNGSAEYRVAQAIAEEEQVSRSHHWPWAIICEVGFGLVALATLAWAWWNR